MSDAPLDDAAHAAGEETRLSSATGLIVLACVIAGIAAYMGIGTALGIAPLYGGFLFSFYFGGIKQSAAHEFPAALLGALGGLTIGASLYWLPQWFETLGLVAALLLIAAALYALIMGWAGMLINNATMMMLTVATIPVVQQEARFGGMACGILLAAALMGVLVLAGQMRARAKLPGSA